MRNIFGHILRTRDLLVFGFIVFACGGCTHLQTNPTGDVPSIAPGRPASAGAQRGISYHLPMVQYNLKVVYALESCPVDAPPTFTIKVEAAERYVPGERFEVDYQAMSSIMKTTNFDISFHDSGTLRTINATAQDQTGTVLTNVARIGLAVAGVATGNPLLASAAALPIGEKTSLNISTTFTGTGSQQVVLRCTDVARANLATLAADTLTIKNLTKEIEALIARVTRLSAIASLEVMSDADRADLSVTVHALLDKEEELRASNRRVATLQQELSASDERGWPEQAGGISAHSGPIAPTVPSLRKLFGLIEVQELLGTQVMNRSPAAATRTPRQSRALEQLEVSCGGDGGKPAIDCLSSLTTLNVALVATVSQPPSPGLGNNGRLDDAVIPHGDPRWARGIFIREAVDARLIMCRAPATVAGTSCSNGDAPVLRDDPVIAPQLGRLRLLPFRSRPFENNHLQLSMRANGFIEQFSYGEESSAAAATGSLADIAERAQTALEAMETERRSDIQFDRDTRTYERNELAASRAEEVAQLTHQVNLLKGQSDLLAAQLGLSGANESVQYAAEKARIDAEVQLLQSQIARLKAANELAALNAN